jgi:hypothetical protein
VAVLQHVKPYLSTNKICFSPFFSLQKWPIPLCFVVQFLRSNSITGNIRDTLYQGLSPTMKASLRSRLQQSSKKDAVKLLLLWLYHWKSSWITIPFSPIYQVWYKSTPWTKTFVLQGLTNVFSYFACCYMLQRTCAEIRGELSTILEWLVPVASNTTK